MSFPVSPVNNTRYTVNGMLYVYRVRSGVGSFIALRRA